MPNMKAAFILKMHQLEQLYTSLKNRKQVPMN